MFWLERFHKAVTRVHHSFLFAFVSFNTRFFELQRRFFIGVERGIEIKFRTLKVLLPGLIIESRTGAEIQLWILIQYILWSIFLLDIIVPVAFVTLYANHHRLDGRTQMNIRFPLCSEMNTFPSLFAALLKLL